MMASTRQADRDKAVYNALKTLRERTPRLLDVVGEGADASTLDWFQTLDARVLPRLSPDFPLIAAITGGGSSGKSTLFNSMVGAEVSTAGGRAGLNRRVLVGVHPDSAAKPAFLAELFRPFGATPQPMADRRILTTTGPPVYVANAALPERVILLDTPDFDVGVGGKYLNRGVAEPVLTAADVLIYIFTNATYNAKSNTDFIRSQLTRIGRRPCILVYRAYASFSDDEVRAHAETVASNLYGPQWQRHVLAMFRADDSNDVASGKAPSRPRRVGGGPDLIATLKGLDPRALRKGQNGAMIADVLTAASGTLNKAGLARDNLAIYRDSLRLAEGQAVAAALLHLPINAIVERIREIFERTDSGFLRFSRKAGRVTGAPLRGLMKLIGKGADKAAAAAGKVDPIELTRNALVEAANGLRRQVLARELTATTTATDPDGGTIIDAIGDLRDRAGLVGATRPLSEGTQAGGSTNIYVAAHPAIEPARQHLMTRTWAAELEDIAAAATPLMALPTALDEELEQIVVEFRQDMPLMKKARAALIGSLNLIPPVVGIVYVFATVDPVGGSTLSAKLSSVFGMHDLWATVTIPASSGLDDATRSHLKKLLDPVVQRWLKSRARPVESLFRQHLTGQLLTLADRRVDDADQLMTRLTAALDDVKAQEPQDG